MVAHLKLVSASYEEGRWVEPFPEDAGLEDSLVRRRSQEHAAKLALRSLPVGPEGRTVAEYLAEMNDNYKAGSSTTDTRSRHFDIRTWLMETGLAPLAAKPETLGDDWVFGCVINKKLLIKSHEQLLRFQAVLEELYF